jgi:ABC-type thiamine transport system ATPase subunit
MPRLDLVKEVPVLRTPRVLQVEGMFDMSAYERCRHEWHFDADLPDAWHIGLIVGPSGSGKSVIARALFEHVYTPESFDWPADRSILDAFPASMSIKDITSLLTSVGLSSPPSWLKPYGVLSTGEQFRAMLARALASENTPVVVDEFTSVVDRTVAKIASAAVAKAVRTRGLQFVAVSCHADIIDWLDPDWILEPHLGRVTRRRLRGRPALTLSVYRVDRSAWRLFARHHYLSHALHPTSRCFLGCLDRQPVVFGAVIHHPIFRVSHYKREHRLVCLPDYQGVGIGGSFSRFLGSLCRGLGFRYFSVTSHPGLIAARARSPDWIMRSSPTMETPTFLGLGRSGQATRLRARFEYVGPAMDRDTAHRLWHSEPVSLW